MVKIDTITSQLVEKEPGYWVSKDHTPVSYPADGMDFTFQLEEQSYWFIHRNRCISAVLQAFPPQGILYDIGGGNGFVSLAARNMGIETVLVEPDPTGSHNALQRGLRPVIAASLDDAGFAPQSLNAVGLFDVLEHIEDDAAFLKKLHTLVRPDGKLYLTVPAYQSLWSTDDASAGHFRRYERRRLNRLLESAGFSICFSSYMFMLLPLPIALFRALPSRLGWRGPTHLDSEATRSEYVAGGGLLESLFKIECFFLARRLVLPFGGSLLVAAVRR